MTKANTARLGLAAAHHKIAKTVEKREVPSSCFTGGFYKSPAAGDQVDSSKPVTISWDTACMENTKAIDIHVLSPYGNAAAPFTFTNVNFAAGSYSATLDPNWWGKNATGKLQLNILEAGEGLYMQQFPAGPIWGVSYSAPTAGATPVDAAAASQESTLNVNNFASGKKVSSGGIAAAVLLPIIAIAALIAFAYVKISRKQAKEKTQRFSVVVDSRMSVHNPDWSSMTPAGANAAIRNSMAFPGLVGGVGVGAAGHRASSLSFGTIRPSEDNRAGVGALYGSSNEEMAQVEQPPVAQLRPGLRQSAFTAERQSRVVSFAEQTRPSHDTRRSMASSHVRPSLDNRRSGVMSRAFHDAFIPPVPTRMDSNMSEASTTSDSTPSGAMSPTQTSGAFSLTAEDIRARMTHNAAPRPSVDEMMPALSLMRHGGEGDAANDNLLPPTPGPTTPAPTHNGGIERSPIMGSMPMQPLPAAAVMSPDDLLRQYAAKRVTGPPSTPTNGGMRVLYAPPTPVTPALSATNPYRQTIISETSRYSTMANEDPYGGYNGH
jgi:hypothetical protein